MTVKKILVSGATGKQGGAAIKAILAKPPPFDYKILALTRNSASPSAKALESDPHVELISGSLTNSAAIFDKAGGAESIWGVFLVTIPSMGKLKKGQTDPEEEQGYNMVDAAVTYKVKHLVLASVDRGGEASDTSPTDIPHFLAKHNVELYLKDKAAGTDMTWTILRPVAFMENLTPDFIGRTFAAMWANMGDVKLQLVATRDIGTFAAQAFAASDSDEYKNKAISLAGDDLNQKEANQVFLRVMGRPMPRSYGIMGSVLQYMIAELGIMFKWFVDTGYGADISQCKKLSPDMLDFATWLKEESGFKR